MNKKNLAILGGGLITLSTIGAVVCSSVTIYMSSRVSNRVTNVQNAVTTLSKAYIKEEQKHTDAQYVTIGNGYEIKDTSAISDAYKNKDDSKLSAEDKETLKLASDVLSKITTDKMSLYQKEVAIHDWIVDNVPSSDDNLANIPNALGNDFTPNGVLKTKQAVCVGYATTFKLFMNMLGADCMIEHNTGLSHSWDVVKLDDNEWYIVDLYSDASNSNKSARCYENFNITNDILNEDGNQFDTSLYPVASGTKYSYVTQNSTKLDDIKKLPKVIKEGMNKNKKQLNLELPKGVDPKYISATIYGISNRTVSEDGPSIDAHYFPVDKDTTILVVTLPVKDDSESYEDKYPSLTKELDKIFGSVNN